MGLIVAKKVCTQVTSQVSFLRFFCNHAGRAPAVTKTLLHVPSHLVLYRTLPRSGNSRYNAKALLGEGPFYDKSREDLVWVDRVLTS